MKDKDYIVCIGGANYDIHSRIQHEVVLKDSNIAHIYASAGGVVRNIAENLAKMGENCVLLTAVGNDGFGQAVIADSQKAGIDCSEVYVDNEHPTSVYLDILGYDGDMCLAANDMRILGFLPDKYFDEKEELIKNAKALVLDANLTKSHIKKICDVAEKFRVKIYADPVSGIKCSSFNESLDKIYFLKPNRMELSKLSNMPCNNSEEIEQAASLLLTKGIMEIAVSLGSDGCYFANNQGDSFFMEAKKVDHVESATGAGDSFMAGYIHASLKGLDSKSCIDYAQKCGALAIQNLGNTSI